MTDFFVDIFHREFEYFTTISLRFYKGPMPNYSLLLTKFCGVILVLWKYGRPNFTIITLFVIILGG